MKAIELAKQVLEKRRQYFDNWTNYVQKIKKIAEEELGKAEVYVFGSIIREDYDASNDVDILIVSPKTLNRIIEREEIKRSEKKIKPTHTAIHSTCT